MLGKPPGLVGGSTKRLILDVGCRGGWNIDSSIEAIRVAVVVLHAVLGGVDSQVEPRTFFVRGNGVKSSA